MPKVTHGAALKNIKLYRVFQAMKRRCYSVKSDMYALYGARGITICDEWLLDPLLFVNWALASGYADGLSIDRIDNFKGYSPSNCRFINPIGQGRNKRYNRMITHNGETRCLSEWAEITGISSASIQVRLDRCGWPIEKALSVKPVRRNLMIDINGDSKTATEWAAIAGVNHSTIMRRLKLGQELLAPPMPINERGKKKC